jgi:hypothetical protein
MLYCNSIYYSNSTTDSGKLSVAAKEVVIFKEIDLKEMAHLQCHCFWAYLKNVVCYHISSGNYS